MRRVTRTSCQSTPSSWEHSVKLSETSAKPSGLRVSVPLKMTSAISPPRNAFADCSPSTQRTASSTLDFPQPFGPTMAVTPSWKLKIAIFNFHEGVTAIVGPNGCGKSNVCDAVRWVLGEQSAKSLRGGEMADVIFNGAESRKPLGFAEVSLNFTECSEELGVAWHEVRVTRRIYRDGNSEYFLNKTGCRLKDIHSLFADTGVGRAAYSIMEQGKIDLILSSRPEDRRSVFEEAAGITKYKTQKKEALRKLEATEANLLRIGDIIKEVKRQIGSLQRQAGKARRYQALHADLRVLETHHSKKKLQSLEQELNECTAEIARVSDTEQATRNEINEGEAKVAAARRELDAADEKITHARAKVQQLENEIASHRHRIEFNEKHGAELRQWIERSQCEIESAETKLREQNAEIESANVLVEETTRLLEQKNQELEHLTE